MDFRAPGYHTEWWYRRRGTDQWDKEGDDWWSCTWSLPENQFHYLVHQYAEAIDLKRRPQDVRRLQLGDLLYYDWHGDGHFGHSTIVTQIDRFGRPLVTYRTLSPSTPVRNGHWSLAFRRDAHRIIGLLLPNQAVAPRSQPDWNVLRPCDTRLAF